MTRIELLNIINDNVLSEDPTYYHNTTMDLVMDVMTDIIKRQRVRFKRSLNVGTSEIQTTECYRQVFKLYIPVYISTYVSYS